MGLFDDTRYRDRQLYEHRHDGGRMKPEMVAPLFVSAFTKERLSREAAEVSARLRKMDTYDESRSDLERQIFWIRQRMEGQCA